jgi:hypothetical protein
MLAGAVKDWRVYLRMLHEDLPESTQAFVNAVPIA